MSDGEMRLQLGVDGATVIPQAMSRAQESVVSLKGELALLQAKSRDAMASIREQTQAGMGAAVVGPIKTEWTDLQVKIEATKQKVKEMSGSTKGSMREARLAAQGLSQEFGLHIPRALTSMMARIPAVQGVMTAAFSAVAVVGLIEVIGHLPKIIQDATDSIMGFGKAAREAYEEAKTRNNEFLNEAAHLAERMREANMEGLTGTAKVAAEQVNLSEKKKELLGIMKDERLQIAALQANLDKVQLTRSSSERTKLQEELNKRFDAEETTARKITGLKADQVRLDLAMIQAQIDEHDKLVKARDKGFRESARQSKFAAHVEFEAGMEAARKSVAAWKEAAIQKRKDAEEQEKLLRDDMNLENLKMAKFDRHAEAPLELQPIPDLTLKQLVALPGTFGKVEDAEETMANISRMNRRELEMLAEMFPKLTVAQVAMVPGIERIEVAVKGADEAQKKWAEDVKRTAEKSREEWTRTWQSMGHEFNSQINSWIMGHERFKAAFYRMETSMTATLFSELEKRAQKKIAHELLTLVHHLLTTNKMVAAHAVAQHAMESMHLIRKARETAADTMANATQATMKSTVDVGIVVSEAAVAAATAYAAYAAFPPVAAAMAAEAFAATMAFAPAATMQHGGIVPAGGMITRLHEKEMVLPAQIAQPLAAAAQSGNVGGHSITINRGSISAVDARGVAKVLERDSRELTRTISRLIRNNPRMR